MFKATDVVDAPHDNNASLLRIVGDLDRAKSTQVWLRSRGLACESPLPATWNDAHQYRMFGYQIKAHENRSAIIEKLGLR